MKAENAQQSLDKSYNEGGCQQPLTNLETCHIKGMLGYDSKSTVRYRKPALICLSGIYTKCMLCVIPSQFTKIILKGTELKHIDLVMPYIPTSTLLIKKSTLPAHKFT